jgi:Ca-activated chloride channel family protein
MKTNFRRSLVLILLLIAATTAAMAYASRSDFTPWPVRPPGDLGDGCVTLGGHLVQNKVLQGSDGTVTLALTLAAPESVRPVAAENRPVDMVMVLDRSGSMNGPKIEDARRAMLDLLASLKDGDRLALVTYSSGVRRHAGLTPLTPSNRQRLAAAIRSFHAQGGTNLGAGLRNGLDLMVDQPDGERLRRVILISDGLANRGITDPTALGRMASVAVEGGFAVSTVGVGSDFNERLMTTIADQGTGRYYYLENPTAFARVFSREYRRMLAAAASAVEIRLPLSKEMSVVDASGYPVRMEGRQAVFHPGDLQAGSTRTLYVKLRVPTGRIANFDLQGIQAKYRHQGRRLTARLNRTFTVACVENPQDVMASIDKKAWEEKVLRDDFNRLKEEVADEIRTGREAQALERIEDYRRRQARVNAVVGSAQVTQNLDTEVESLRGYVRDTFQGAPSAVAKKQKHNAKSLQYEGYKGRR